MCECVCVCVLERARQLFHSARPIFMFCHEYDICYKPKNLVGPLIAEKEGVQLPISKQPIKLLHLKSKGDRTIMSSAISQDATRVAYADDQGATRLYDITVVSRGL